MHGHTGRSLSDFEKEFEEGSHLLRPPRRAHPIVKDNAVRLDKDAEIWDSRFRALQFSEDDVNRIRFLVAHESRGVLGAADGFVFVSLAIVVGSTARSHVTTSFPQDGEYPLDCRGTEVLKFDLWK